MSAHLYDAYVRAQDRIRGVDPDDDPAALADLIERRDTLLAAYGLPATGHNTARLYDCVERGAALSDWLDDVDTPLPDVILADEALFLSTLASYFSWRGVSEWIDRIWDIEAFLGLAHHTHNLGVIGAWLRGALSFLDMRTQVSNDREFLESAVC